MPTTHDTLTAPSRHTHDAPTARHGRREQVGVLLPCVPPATAREEELALLEALPWAQQRAAGNTVKERARNRLREILESLPDPATWDGYDSGALALPCLQTTPSDVQQHCLSWLDAASLAMLARCCGALRAGCEGSLSTFGGDGLDRPHG